MTIESSGTMTTGYWTENYGTISDSGILTVNGTTSGVNSLITTLR